MQLDEPPHDIDPPSPFLGFIVHAVLKAIVMGLYVLRAFFGSIFSELVVNELVAIFVVADFWCTKNVAGKKMLGLRWFFENDEYGTEKFMFECRANEEYVSASGPKLFWVVLLVYTAFPGLMVLLEITKAPFFFIQW